VIVRAPSSQRSVDASSTVLASKKPKLRKVLHLINGEHFSGAERVQDLLAMTLPRFGYEVGFSCLKPDRFPGVRRSSTELFETPMRSKLDFRVVSRVIEHARRHGYSMLHAHTPRTLLVARLAARQLKCPLVYHVHSPVGRDSERGLSNFVNGMMERWSLRGVDRMICVSNSLGEYMQDLGHAASKIRIVPNGVSLVDPLPQPGGPEAVWTIGTMALFRPRKGMEVLLEALAILKEEQVPVKLRAVGPFETSEYEAEILGQVERLGVTAMIEWTGFQTDVNQQLRQMDVFVLPSLYGEGLPMVVLEAMANGVPVIASRVEGIPEAVRDGIDGLIFDPADANDLAAKLSSLVGDHSRWKSMSASSLCRQRESLSDVSMARGVAAIYDEFNQ
jgi:glycosyltransferase involved in cell wall biosynthesis